ncbi:RagB/SusD family nutrient uptake outer membrane protein [Pleomorphovibrio marinus]|uniref:RagB/SusD family nutrient uptake outer membrane protein n=1 Tax=Pleomorphovibrio marinus TaxID=2164132 RepID=UPI0018E50CA0|nr:RagB/SusD family nutrient uptake outer membrane protein [Pleomorphovibrio marinus]
MKKIKNINISLSLLIAMVIGLSGCDLDEFNPSGATAEAVWESTPENFMTLVNAAYHDYRGPFNRIDGLFMFESGTDLWFNRDKRLWAGEFSQYVNMNATTGMVNSMWNRYWSGVRHCNEGVSRIDNVDWPNEEVRNLRLAEIRFMRAFYYWFLIETYGNVMLRDAPDGALTAQRSSIEELYNLVLGDLQFAVQHLPAQWDNANRKRADQAAALGLLGRLALTRAYYDMSSEHFTMARDAAIEVIERQGEFGLELWDNYYDLLAPENRNDNKEVMWEESIVDDVNLNYDANSNRMHQFYLSPYAGRLGLVQSVEYGRDNGRQLMPSWGLLNFYDEDIDARYGASFQEVWICNTSDEIVWDEDLVRQYYKDESLIGTVMRPGIDTALMVTKKAIPQEEKRLKPYIIVDRDSIYNVQGDGTINTGFEYPALTKFMDPITRENPNSQQGRLSSWIMRLPEMYLIAAEAEHQLGNDGAAAEYINVIRERAAIKEPVDHTADMMITAADIDLDFILDERARELCGEFIRWFDLKRTRKLDERISRYNPDITNFQEHHYLRPIPQGELDALENGAEFGQNPGY